MAEDIAIKYNAKLIEVEDNIEQLESLGMSASHFKDTVERIKKETEEGVQNSYDTFSGADSFRNDALIGVYEKSAKELDSLNRRIVSEYEDYYKIQAKCEELNAKCDRLNAIDIPSVVEDTSVLLKCIKQSTTIDYNDEKPIVENVYKLVYRVIKLELVYTNQSRLLEQSKISEVDISYLAEMIKDDIQKLSNNQTTELSSKIQEIDKKGFDDIHYLDKELILLISILQNKKLLKKAEESFSQKIDQCKEVFDELNERKVSYQGTQTEIAEIKNKIKKISRKKFGKRLFIYINMGLVGTAILGSIKLCKDLAKEKQYKTIVVTYDTDSLEEQTTIEYLPFIKDSVEIKEYSPWEGPGYFRDEYKRNVYTYDLSNVELEFD